MYRIHYLQGNGYRCSCCRNEEYEYEDCDDEEEVIYWLSELAACKKKLPNPRSLRDDRHVIEIVRTEPENLTDKFQADPELVAQIVMRHEEAEEERKREEEEKAKEVRFKNYENLKKEFK